MLGNIDGLHHFKGNENKIYSEGISHTISKTLGLKHDISYEAFI